MTVPFVFLNITFNGGVIGNASQNNVTVVYGVNNINFDVFLDGTSNNLVPDFIMNFDSLISVLTDPSNTEIIRSKYFPKI